MLRKVTKSLVLIGALSIPSMMLSQSGAAAELSDSEMEELVRRSYQYVAMFNVINKAALDADNPASTGGYNRVEAPTELFDHRIQLLARPNNDTLYPVATIDVTEEPMVLRMPAFDSTYVSLQVSAYDHYVDIPLSTTAGDFDEPSTMLFYSDRTPDYDGVAVEGIDKTIELTGDFAVAVFRVMPHAAEPERMERNRTAMRSIEIVPLSAFLEGTDAAPKRTLEEDLARFPAFGSDMEIFADRFLEVMQFVFNHTTFDEDDPIDQGVLAAFEPLGVVPGKAWDPDTAADIDGAALRATAEKVAADAVSKMGDAAWLEANLSKQFLPKGEMTLELLTFQSVIGPIGLPATQAAYPPINTADGAPMNAMFDYEIVIAPEDMPPANAFWSATLYDAANGFFIPNDRFKYSVGENAGFKLDEGGGIRIVIAAEQPEGVPEENWLPIAREDLDLNIIMRIYAPDIEEFATWSPPVARKLN